MANVRGGKPAPVKGKPADAKKQGADDKKDEEDAEKKVIRLNSHSVYLTALM